MFVMISAALRRRAKWLVSVLGAFAVAGTASAQVTEDWYGSLRIEYGPTGVEGMVMAHVRSSDDIGLAILCTSNRSDFTPCSLELWGDLPRPSPHMRYIVLRIYAGGEMIFTDTLARNEVQQNAERIALDLDISAGAGGALWSAFANPDMLAIEFADANGLGRPIPYAQADLDIRPLPQRAIDLVTTMRTSSERPMDWAREIVGSCEALMVQSGVVRMTMRGAQFEETACYDY